MKDSQFIRPKILLNNLTLVTKEYNFDKDIIANTPYHLSPMHNHKSMTTHHNHHN